jgi:hypothetical protein
MAYTQITFRWNGFTGAPGYTRMKFLGNLTQADSNTAAANLRAFLSACLATYAPAGSSITCDTTVGLYDGAGVQDGELSLSSVPAAIGGTGAGAYAGGAGAVVNWLTGAFHLGRKVRGRTFLVPLTQAAFQADGTLSTAFQSAAQTAATTFATSNPTPAVFSKKPFGSGFATTIAVITGATIPDRTAILRSRRD